MTKPKPRSAFLPIVFTIVGTVICAGVVAVLVVWLQPRSESGGRDEAIRDLQRVHSYINRNRASGGKPILTDGRVEVGPGWEYTQLNLVAADGKICISDPWGNPVRAIRRGGQFTVYSNGPNGKDESGRGDDITLALPK